MNENSSLESRLCQRRSLNSKIIYRLYVSLKHPKMNLEDSIFGTLVSRKRWSIISNIVQFV